MVSCPAICWIVIKLKFVARFDQAYGRSIVQTIVIFLGSKFVLLNKTWAAGLGKWRSRGRRLLKNDNKFYKNVTCYKTDPSFHQGGRPTTNKTATVLTTSKISSWVREGLNVKTDWLTVSCKVTLTLTDSGSEVYTAAKIRGLLVCDIM
jgi:hypothetical protein